MTTKLNQFKLIFDGKYIRDKNIIFQFLTVLLIALTLCLTF